MNGLLSIYKASAGSGKTHTLTGYYLHLVLRGKGMFRHIMAVTFTNKATDEMKKRILEELFFLADGASSSFLNELCESLGMTESEIRKRAKECLSEILHDFSNFNVSTIDKFFFKTMRSFARELRLNHTFSIETDKDLTLNYAYDQMLLSLREGKTTSLLQWLIRFINERIASGQAWNFKHEIINLGNELFREAYKIGKRPISTEEFSQQINEFRKEIQRRIAIFKQKNKEIGVRALGLIQNQGLLLENFKGGSRTPLGQFKGMAEGVIKYPTKTFEELTEPDKFHKATEKDPLKSQIETVASKGLIDCVLDTLKLYDEEYKEFSTLELIQKNLYSWGLLNNIQQGINEYEEQFNVMMISRNNELLKGIIDHNPTPFIYESLGNRIDHYMIDEFQDTSTMQWENFEPLLEDSLSRGKENLLVGDVKQSIYRFRNSNWHLLEDKVPTNPYAKVLNLDTNWRSCPNVINFNNVFFKEAPIVLQEYFNGSFKTELAKDGFFEYYLHKIEQIYSDVAQQIPSKTFDYQGRVSVDLFLSEERGTEVEEYAEEQLILTTCDLLEQGYALQDITILVRTNREAERVVHLLSNSVSEVYPQGIRTISDEALFIYSSPSIRFFIALLEWGVSSSDVKFRLAELSFQSWTGRSLKDVADINSFKSSISSSGLYQLLESFYSVFKDFFVEDDTPYLMAFADLINDFIRKNGSNVALFLEWWEESGQKKSIASSDDLNAIRVMTIHKSKGLGFKIAIVPFVTWDMLMPPRGNILWCSPQKELSFSGGMLPLRYASDMEYTLYKKEYCDEKLQIVIEQFNLLYVAFTRAKEQLHIMGWGKGKASTSSLKASELIQKVFFSGADLLTGSRIEEQELDGEIRKLHLSLGEPQKQKTESFNDSLESIDVLMGGVSRQIGDRFKFNLKGKDYFFNQGELQKGTILHDLLSNVKTIEDIAPIFRKFVLQGILAEENAKIYYSELMESLKNPEVQSWFHPDLEVLNEIDIIHDKACFSRPDRIIKKGQELSVIDYKFGLQKNKYYHKQVENYMNLISEMGYKEVKGYIWYVSLNEIEEVHI